MAADISVLLITFNRPETTKKVLSKILEAKPSKLFIFSDGPREKKIGEDILVHQCRSLFENLEIDWECKVEKWFMEKNLGCGKGVSYSITKAFTKTDKLIILEDDCLPHASFFTFCEYMLEKFEKEENIMHISGTRWNEEFNIGNNNYFFSCIGHIWGWATWKRAWEKYDYEMQSLNKKETEDKILKILKKKIFLNYWLKSFFYVYKQQNKHTWDYQWQLTLFINSGLSINPNVNLISNLGIQGVHASNIVSESFFKKTYEWENSYCQNVEVKRNAQFDEYHMYNHFIIKNNVFERLKKLLLVRILKLK